ncbi:hypothetical protein PGJ_00006920 [Porphyromonas gingivalis AJW4]|nr:hypothetical protein PGJ_00006920 [Porphyromonas gingivalis AJW4]
MTLYTSVHNSTMKVAKFPHMQKYIFVYTPINFRIYGNKFPYIRKYISLIYNYSRKGH